MKGPCWIWPGTVNGSGYGVKHVRGRMLYAHRLVYEAATGTKLPPRTSGLCIDHLCRERRCVNPFHMEIVTLGENGLRGTSPAARNARKKVCLRGHPFKSGKRGNGKRRYCATCITVNKNRRAK